MRPSNCRSNHEKSRVTRLKPSFWHAESSELPRLDRSVRWTTHHAACCRTVRAHISTLECTQYVRWFPWYPDCRRSGNAGSNEAAAVIYRHSRAIDGEISGISGLACIANRSTKEREWRCAPFSSPSAAYLLARRLRCCGLDSSLARSKLAPGSQQALIHPALRRSLGRVLGPSSAVGVRDVACADL